MVATIFTQTTYYEIIISPMFQEDFLKEISMVNGKLNIIKLDAI